MDTNRDTDRVPDVFTVDTSDTLHPSALGVPRGPSADQLDPHPIRDDLADIRAMLPFVSVVPWPKSSFLLNLGVAAGAAAAGEIKIPDNAVLMKISGQSPFLFTEKGKSDGLTSALAQAQGNPATSVDVLSSGETEWMYCAGMKSVSVRNLSATAEQLVGARFIFRDEI